MQTRLYRAGLLACGLTLCLTVALALPGCHRHKHREIRVHEEQRQGPVEENRPGEMIVE